MRTYIDNIEKYDSEKIYRFLTINWLDIFEENINKGDNVVLKPNWLAASHKYVKEEWESVITHPSIITAVLRVVLECLDGLGEVVITDGPQTDSSWKGIMARMSPDEWIEMGENSGVKVSIIDLREDEWISEDEVTVARKKLEGDPKGSTETNLGKYSEFYTHKPSNKGYYGADYNKHETNVAHSHGNHRYRVSRSVIDSDVFINLPKLKTHKKAGITCSLKNLVGINTYKNYLPHHNEGTPDEGGDQFPESTLKNKTEVYSLERFKTLLNKYPEMGRSFKSIKKIGKKIFGDTTEIIRSGNWYGNDTLWRMVLDLNKILFYSNPDGSLREDNVQSQKKYISIVDGIIGGEGKGPEAPDSKRANVLIAGDNPVSVDAVCAKMIGFDWTKIPTIKNAFNMEHYPICDFKYDQIRIRSSDSRYNKMLKDISIADITPFKPHFGWVDHIEIN